MSEARAFGRYIVEHDVDATVARTATIAPCASSDTMTTRSHASPPTIAGRSPHSTAPSHSPNPTRCCARSFC